MELRLENWELLNVRTDPYKAPEQGRPALRGQVYGHEDFLDGDLITTSEIVDSDGNWVRTQNHEYRLGLPAPQYQDWYEETYGRKMNVNSPFPSKEEEL